MIDFPATGRTPRELEACGGKGANLFRLKDHGFAVPAFIVVPATLVDGELEPLKPFIHACLKRLATGGDETMIEVADAIREKIRRHAFSAPFEEGFRTRFRERFPNGGLFAVRSSATVEDGAETSFAGMFDSFLSVHEQHLLDRIKDCIASAFSVRVLKYKALRGLDPFSYGTAVVVQEMIAAVKAGVLFTMNAEGNLNESLVCAAFGPGEGVVQGTADTDSYCIDRRTRATRRVAGRRGSAVGRDGSTSAAAPCAVLEEEELQRLFAWGQAVERLFGAPQDIEFAFDRDGGLHLLQSRPITTIRFDEIRILDNANIVESYPGITLPLTFSFAKMAYRKVFISAAKAFGASAAELVRLEPHFAEMIALVKGRIYYQLHNWYAILQGFFTSDRALRAWEASLGVSNPHVGVRRTTVARRLKNAAMVVWLFLKHRRACARFFRTFETAYREARTFLERARRERLSAKDLFTLYERMKSQLFTSWGTTIVNDFFAFGSFDRLGRMVASYGLEAHPNLANDLLCGTPGVESERVLLELLDLKEQIVRQPDLRRLFDEEPARVLDDLRSRFPAFAARFFGYVDRYGDRTLEELKLESPNLRTQPELLVELLRNYLDNPLDPERFETTQTRIRARAEATVAARQRPWSPRTWLFAWLLGITRETVKQRENMRFVRTRAFGLIRELFLEIGARMAEEGLLEQARDVFYLDLEALRSFCLDGAREGRKVRVAEEKRRCRDYERLSLPDKILFMEGRMPTFGEPAEPGGTRARQLRGLAISSGVARGSALVLGRPELNRKVEGAILVTRMTDPGWIFLMAQAKGIVSEKGSPLSHTAIVGRELGIPTIVDVPGATRFIRTGDRLHMDATSGLIELLD